MKKILLILIGISTLVACKDAPKTETPQTTTITEHQTETPKASTLPIGCYIYNQNGTQIILKVTDNDKDIKGNLTYALAEKDANLGTFEGTFKDHKLLANYTFQSEGKLTTRQVAFVLKDNQLIEGYGELNAEGTEFTNPLEIKYSSNMPLTKTECME